ncbi:MAG: hypothetical protein ACR2RV_12810 [Verrucomicrobiales bacterium]
MKLLPLVRTICLCSLGCLPASADEVVLSYEARVASVPVMSPFGLSTPIGTAVTGTFTYETSAAVDSSPAADRGTYLLTAGGGFSARFLGHEVTGSAAPLLNVENFDFASHTFRFADGELQRQFPADQGLMAFDGIVAEDIGVSLSISDPARSSFTSDRLPALFPMVIGPGGPDYFVTLTLRDDRGSMSLEVSLLRQVLPEPPLITDIRLDGLDPVILFDSQPGQLYDVEFSTDLEAWITIREDVAAEGFATEVVDDALSARLGESPTHAYYRIRESN